MTLLTDEAAKRAVQTTALTKGLGYVSLRDVKKRRIEGADVFMSTRGLVTFIRTDDGGPVSEHQVNAVLALSE